MTLTSQSNITLSELACLLERMDDIVIVGHVNPDGDCIGSQLALMHALRSLGKTVTCLRAQNEESVEHLRFLPGVDEMELAADFDKPMSTFISVDVTDRNRIGEAACFLAQQAHTTIVIDHHATENRESDYRYIDPDAPSTTTLIWQLITLLGVQHNVACAICCYTGLVTDTGRFQYQNTTPLAFQVAAEMVQNGVDAASVSSELFQNRSQASVALEGVVINRMVLGAQGQYALSWLSCQDFESHHATKADAELLVDTLRSIKGVRVACMLREQENEVRGSFRAKDNTDVRSLAQAFGGGGHRAAAGFSLPKPLSEAVETVNTALSNLFTSTDESPDEGKVNS